MKTIGIVVPDINFIGGAETVAMNLAENLSLQFNVYILSLFSVGSSNGNSTIIHLGIKYNKNPIGRLLTRFVLLGQVLANVDIHFDYLIGNNFFRYFAVPKPSFGVRQIEIQHMNYYDGIYPPTFKTRLSIKWRNIIYKKLYATIALTEGTKILLNEGGVSNVKVIPNIVHQMPDRQAVLKNKTVVAIGRLTKQKGFHFLITAWRKVADNFQGWNLEIYGEGSLKKELNDEIDRLQLQGQVHLMGNTMDVKEKLLNGSIFVLSSLYEGFPMVLLEAMALGLPCVAFDCDSGPAEIINEGEDGFLVDVKAIDQLAERLSFLMANEKDRIEMGNNARKNIQRFSWKYIEKKWLDVLQ